MANYCIMTNNPAVRDAYAGVARYTEGSVSDILLAVRDAVHLGAELISHPLAGSLKPNESPCKSVMLSTRQGTVDARSLSIIEDALAVLRSLPAKDRTYAPEILADFAVIDLDLMRSAMEALPSTYHSYP